MKILQKLKERNSFEGNDFGENSSSFTQNILSSKKTKIGAGVALCAVLASQGVYHVDSSYKGVETRFGKYLETTDPGLNFKIPFVDSVEQIDVKKQRSIEVGQGYDKEGNKKPHLINIGEAQMLTGDENIIEIKSVVQYNVADPVKFAFRAENPEGILRDSLESSQRLVVGNNGIDSILTTGRGQMASDTKKHLQDIVNDYDLGINIVDVQFPYVKAPRGDVQRAFSDVQKAREEKSTVINQAQSHSNKVLPAARAYAAQVTNEAEAYSTRVLNEALGEADRFTSVLEEYRKAPEVTRERMVIDALSEVLPTLEGKYIISGGDSFNLLNLKGNQQLLGGQK